MGVLTDMGGPACIVTMDWPERRNAIGPSEAADLSAALAAAGSSAARVVVLTGRGTFCAGGDLHAVAAIAEDGPEAVRASVYGRFQALMRTLLAIPTPTIAALDGPAIGLGFDIALACDMRLAGPDAWCRQGWGSIGLIPATGGELLLRRRAPNLLWKLIADQPKLGPTDLDRLGLAELVAGSAVDAAVARAERLAELPTDALNGYVTISRRELRAEIEPYLETCLDIQVGLICSEHFRAKTAEILGR
jgi:enoyl-CoA hydratase/carnithine racemase